MGYISGLQDYLDKSYNVSVFDEALSSKNQWELHLHNHRIVTARVLKNPRFDLKIGIEGGSDELLPKTDIKFLYPKNLSGSIITLLKTDNKVKEMGLEPIISPSKRHHIKNKSLFPLIKEKQVVFFTLLEGEVIRGVIGGFSRYEITVNLKGGLPVTILRHAVYDLRDKKGRCFLKSFQETHRDWEKSPVYISSIPEK